MARPAVATSHPSVLPTLPAKMTPAACAPLVPAFAEEGATVHAGPDTQSKIIVTLRARTPVCAAAVSQGFGFRRVRFADATGGFVKDSSLVE
jgi:hypothetical protein